MKLYVNVPNVQ